MSYAPAPLSQLCAYLGTHDGISCLGIVGDSAHTYGYHLGKDRLPSGDYSNQLQRDRNGLTNAASAIDIGGPGIVALCAWMVAQARAGKRPDTREIIGPGSNGRAYRWAVENGWAAELRSDGDSHEWHIHESYFRDSENRDKIQYFRPYFEEDYDVLDLTQKLSNGKTLNDVLVSIYARTDYVANKVNLAGQFADIKASLAAILAAALDDGDATVVLDPSALEAVKALEAKIDGVAQATADLVHADLAD